MPARKGSKNALGNKGGGRKSEYRDNYPEQAFKLALLGATDVEIADFFQVSEMTINTWKNKHEKFSLALKDGKLKADTEIAHKLYHKALGAEWTQEQAFKVKESRYDNNGKKVETEKVVTVPVKCAAPPDTPAISLWLRNRQSGKWRDKVEHEIQSDALVSLLQKIDGATSAVK